MIDRSFRLQFASALMGIAAMAVSLPAVADEDSPGQSPFRVRTSRPSYPEAIVARPLTLEKEWAEFGLTYAFRDVTQYSDSEGELHDTAYDFRYSWLNFDARYGFTKNMTFFMSIPFSVMSERTGGNDGEKSVSGTGMGDIRFGMTWQPYLRTSENALTALSLTWDTKQPSGNESAGAPGNRALLLGTGTTNTSLVLHAKQRIGPVAAVANAGYTHKFSAVTMWVRDTTVNGLNGRFKPGDEITAGLHLQAQPIRLAALDVGADYVNRMESKVGASSNGVSPGNGLQTIPDSDFEALNASARVVIQPSVNWDFVVGASHPVMSRNSGVLFPLEDLSQSYGTTFNGGVLFRW